MAEPHRFLVRVIIGAFAGLAFLHRPSAGERNPAWRIQRPKIRLGHVLAEMRACNQLVSKQDIETVPYAFNREGLWFLSTDRHRNGDKYSRRQSKSRNHRTDLLACLLFRVR